MTLTCGSYFSGTGGSDMGARAAGFTPIFAVEYDEAVAGSYRANVGEHVIVADLRTIDPATLPYVDWFMASPPCQGHSVARDHARLGTRDDLDFAPEIIAYVKHHQPRFVMVENVIGYRRHQACADIVAALTAQGYSVSVNNVHMHKHGVVQSRQRLVILASYTGFAPRLDLFEQTPTEWGQHVTPAELAALPTSKLFPALLQRVGELDKVPVFPAIYDAQNVGRSSWTVRGCTQPMFTIVSSCWKAIPRVIMDRDHSDIRLLSLPLLARFAGFYPDFVIPANKRLACHVIGNAVPPVFAEKVGRLLLSASA